MQAVARYDFVRKENAVTRYLLERHEGEEIPNFLAENKSGEKFIEFLRNTQGSRFYEYGFYCGIVGGKHKRLTGVNFTKKSKNRTYGDDRNIGRSDALLFEFSEDMSNLSVWFIPNKAGKSREMKFVEII